MLGDTQWDAREIAEWLRRVERLAGRAYAQAALAPGLDPELRALLLELAADEAWHYHAMASVSKHLDEIALRDPSAFRLDEETCAQVEAPFHEMVRALHEGELSERAILRCMAVTERSEWNPLFCYALEGLMAHQPEFQAVAAAVQSHLDKVDRFLATRLSAEDKSAWLGSMPRLWHKRCLIVDDSAPVRQFLVAVASKMATVVTAENGREAFAELQAGHFDAVVSDLQMPEMDGLELLDACDRHFEPGCRPPFLLLSGALDEACKADLDRRGVPWLEKPARLSELRRRIGSLLDEKPAQRG